jgi:hypothetical protein
MLLKVTKKNCIGTCKPIFMVVYFLSTAISPVKPMYQTPSPFVIIHSHPSQELWVFLPMPSSKSCNWFPIIHTTFNWCNCNRYWVRMDQRHNCHTTIQTIRGIAHEMCLIENHWQGGDFVQCPIVAMWGIATSHHFAGGGGFFAWSQWFKTRIVQQLLNQRIQGQLIEWLE